MNNGVLDGEHDVENLDPSFTSKLQSSNLNVQLFSQNTGGARGHSFVETVIPPTYTANMEFWDVGFVNPIRGQFIRVNAMSAQPIERKTHMRSFMAYLKHLNAQERYNVKKEFSFNLVNANFRFSDFYMPEKRFLEMFEDQDVQFISEKVKEEKMEKRERELREFFQHMANAAKNVFGEISLKKLKALLEPHIQAASATSPRKTVVV